MNIRESERVEEEIYRRRGLSKEKEGKSEKKYGVNKERDGFALGIG